MRDGSLAGRGDGARGRRPPAARPCPAAEVAGGGGSRSRRRGRRCAACWRPMPAPTRWRWWRFRRLALRLEGGRLPGAAGHRTASRRAGRRCPCRRCRATALPPDVAALVAAPQRPGRDTAGCGAGDDVPPPRALAARPGPGLDGAGAACRRMAAWPAPSPAAAQPRATPRQRLPLPAPPPPARACRAAVAEALDRFAGEVLPRMVVACGLLRRAWPG